MQRKTEATFSTAIRLLAEAVNACASVERVVLTSSVAAIAATDCKGEGVAFTEADWAKDVSETCLPYNLSKKLAEEAAWEMANAQSRWKLVTINPGLVVGPPIGDRSDGSSIDSIGQVFNGKLALAPYCAFGYVDSRDVAAAHCLAMVHPNAEGRYICVENSYSFHDVGAFVKERFPKQKVPLPGGFVFPKRLLSVLGPLRGLRRDVIRMQIGRKLVFDNSKIQRELGFKFHAGKTAIQDMCTRLVDLGIFKPAA